MAMTPENYVRLEKNCVELCLKCSKIVSEYNHDNIEIEIEAKEAYEEIIAMETMLCMAIQNAKTPSIRKKYDSCLKDIQSYKGSIYLIAHII